MKSLARMFVAIVAANVSTWIGVIALVVGVALVMMGVPVLWLVWAGAGLTLLALVTRYLLAQRLHPAMDRLRDENLITIYMPLLNEGVDVWRPVEALKVGDLGYMVTENPPADEEWAFKPGHLLRCEERQLSDGTRLVVVANAT